MPSTLRQSVRALSQLLPLQVVPTLQWEAVHTRYEPGSPIAEVKIDIPHRHIHRVAPELSLHLVHMRQWAGDSPWVLPRGTDAPDPLPYEWVQSLAFPGPDMSDDFLVFCLGFENWLRQILPARVAMQAANRTYTGLASDRIALDIAQLSRGPDEERLLAAYLHELEIRQKTQPQPTHPPKPAPKPVPQIADTLPPPVHLPHEDTEEAPVERTATPTPPKKRKPPVTRKEQQRPVEPPVDTRPPDPPRPHRGRISTTDLAMLLPQFQRVADAGGLGPDQLPPSVTQDWSALLNKILTEMKAVDGVLRQAEMEEAELRVISATTNPAPFDALALVWSHFRVFLARRGIDAPAWPMRRIPEKPESDADLALCLYAVLGVRGTYYLKISQLQMTRDEVSFPSVDVVEFARLAGLNGVREPLRLDAPIATQATRALLRWGSGRSSVEDPKLLPKLPLVPQRPESREPMRHTEMFRLLRENGYRVIETKPDKGYKL